MEPSEPRPESEAPEAGPDEPQSVEPPGPDVGPEDEEKKEVACWGFLDTWGVGNPRGYRGAASSGQDGSTLGGGPS